MTVPSGMVRVCFSPAERSNLREALFFSPPSRLTQSASPMINNDNSFMSHLIFINGNSTKRFFMKQRFSTKKARCMCTEPFSY